MASKRSLNVVEMHFEKGLLGLAVLVVLGVIVLHVMGRNRIEYNGQQLGPDELDEAVAARASMLKSQIDSQKAEKPEVPRYAQKLRDEFGAGVLGGKGLPTRLRLATALGTPLAQLPEEKVGIVSLVTPLAPSRPVARSGINLVQGEAAPIGERTAATPPSDEPVEEAWVTVAAWFPKAAQSREMTGAGYEAYRAHVHVVGLDVQRQEMTASGEFTDWQDILPGKAMPEVDVPDPAFDSASGELLNQRDLDTALELIKASQRACMQPDFYQIAAGDPWEPPPLTGPEEDEDEEAGGGTPPALPERPERLTGGGPPPAPPTGPPGGPRPPGGGGLGPGPGAGAAAAAAKEKQAAQKRIKAALAEAQRAVREKDWSKVESAANSVVGDSHATTSQRRKAEGLVATARRAAEKERERNAVRPPTESGAATLYTNPDSADHDPAVWFHDDSVEPGKTYRYRMRVKLWNRYVGKRNMVRDPEQAGQALVAGEWSLPSDPITVAPKTHFFVKGPRFGSAQPTATVDVFRWHAGEWYTEAFHVQVGDVIGEKRAVRTSDLDESGRPVKTDIDFGTGAIVLDLRPDEPVWGRRAVGKGDFTYSEAKALKLVYLDPTDGQVKERIDRLDRLDPVLKRLRDELGEQ